MSVDKPNTTILEALIAALEARLGLRLAREGDRIYLAATIGELVADQLERELGSKPEPEVQPTPEPKVQEPKPKTSSPKKAPPPKPTELKPAELKPIDVDAVLAFIRSNGPVSGAEIIALWKGHEEKPSPRYKRILAKLIEASKIETEGTGRGMTYRIKAD